MWPGGSAPGSLATNGVGITATTASGIGTGGGAGQVLNVSAATYAATPTTERGFTYTNAGGAATTEIQLPTGCAVGDVRSIAQTNGAQTIRLKFPPGEVGWIGGATSTAGGTIATGADGAFISFRKVSATRWQAFGAAGTVGVVT